MWKPAKLSLIITSSSLLESSAWFPPHLLKFHAKIIAKMTKLRQFNLKQWNGDKIT